MFDDIFECLRRIAIGAAMIVVSVVVRVGGTIHQFLSGQVQNLVVSNAVQCLHRVYGSKGPASTTARTLGIHRTHWNMLTPVVLFWKCFVQVDRIFDIGGSARVQQVEVQSGKCILREKFFV